MKLETLPHILVVDDDDRLRDLLRRYLSEHGFLVTTARDATEAFTKLESLQFDLMVLDIMMPGETGLELACRLRADSQKKAVPILLLTAMGEPEDRISGLESGADDYLTKPFEPRELVLRIRAILRRMEPSMPAISSQGEVAFGDYRLDVKRGRLTKAGEAVHLTTQEQEMLLLLGRQAGRPVSREALSHAGGMPASERSVDVQINRLRKKLEPVPSKPQYIQTARGSGYVLQVD